MQNCSRIERDFIVANLQTVLFLQEDIIIRQGEDSYCLYFINRGKVAVKILEQTVDKDIQMKRIQECKDGTFSVLRHQDQDEEPL